VLFFRHEADVSAVMRHLNKRRNKKYGTWQVQNAKKSCNGTLAQTAPAISARTVVHRVRKYF
jgi:hypothetical protein